LSRVNTSLSAVGVVMPTRCQRCEILVFGCGSCHGVLVACMEPLPFHGDCEQCSVYDERPYDHCNGDRLAYLAESAVDGQGSFY